MTIRIGETAPDFDADTTTGPINFHEWIGSSWAFFFSHPGDFTPVCTTEMGRTAQLAERFAELNTKPIGLSTDSVEEHLSWISDVNETQNTVLRFPIVADPDLRIAKLYEMIHPSQSETAAVRSVFIIDPAKKVRLTMTYPLSIGRNFDEIIRVIMALQTSDKNRVSMPADWQPGQDVIIPPSIKNDEAKTLFPQGWNELRPYLRMTKI
ncbi:peroxidase [Devosia limi DSM 17137]|uniref:Thioredoxin peroxidase n=2 Tax=Devosia TaxID=46913 RepID=A0A0F5LV81_9HYPH|nr:MULTISPECIES: peroxiredoxin [Devosia]MBU1334353.1 peroxiredoxin [Alphaproteobacteria bacterium]KFL29745.1 peroxidase [Devosia riboflavina]KKB86196.1 peroxidase [Devosia limi DSM 17137]MBU1559697.1 peroxiredoxin [Alphaproteobacteria bacterium]MBU2305076.1 peroxiredoxin [Alphaproteobacteria bacterium]